MLDIKCFFCRAALLFLCAAAFCAEPWEAMDAVCAAWQAEDALAEDAAPAEREAASRAVASAEAALASQDYEAVSGTLGTAEVTLSLHVTHFADGGWASVAYDAVFSFAGERVLSEKRTVPGRVPWEGSAIGSGVQAVVRYAVRASSAGRTFTVQAVQVRLVDAGGREQDSFALPQALPVQVRYGRGTGVTVTVEEAPAQDFSGRYARRQAAVLPLPTTLSWHHADGDAWWMLDYRGMLPLNDWLFVGADIGADVPKLGAASGAGFLGAFWLLFDGFCLVASGGTAAPITTFIVDFIRNRDPDEDDSFWTGRWNVTLTGSFGVWHEFAGALRGRVFAEAGLVHSEAAAGAGVSLELFRMNRTYPRLGLGVQASYSLFAVYDEGMAHRLSFGLQVLRK